MWLKTQTPSYMDFVAVSTIVDGRVGWVFGYVQSYDDEEEGIIYIMRRETYASVRSKDLGDQVEFAQEMRVETRYIRRAVWTVLGPVAVLPSYKGK